VGRFFEEEDMTLNIRPLDDRVMIKRLEAEEKTKGGIVLPDTAKEKPQKGEVVSVGIGRILDSGDRLPMAVKQGDKVLFGKFSGTEVKFGGEEYVIMKETEILAKLEK
jgi:chaperonin GroES